MKRINALSDFIELSGQKAEDDGKFILLILDGLQQLENTDTAVSLSWIPKYLHPGIL